MKTFDQLTKDERSYVFLAAVREVLFRLATRDASFEEHTPDGIRSNSILEEILLAGERKSLSTTGIVEIISKTLKMQVMAIAMELVQDAQYGEGAEILGLYVA